MSRLPVLVVDYGAGNLRSVAKALEAVGGDPLVTSEPAYIRQAPALVLPGVGAGNAAMRALERLRLVQPLLQYAASGRPLFGVCLGMQLLMESSEEGPSPCLGLIRGRVKRLPPGPKVPHMGWNQVQLLRPHPVFFHIPSGANFYFVHSYYAELEDAAVGIGVTDYGISFSSVVAQGNLIATQFHPEKSGQLGLELYRNFLRLAAEA